MLIISSFLFCHFSQNTVWKGQVCWRLEAEEVGVRDAGGATHSKTTRAKTARAAPSKMVGETSTSLGGKEGEEGTGATHNSSCQKGLVRHQWWVASISKCSASAGIQAFHCKSQCLLCKCWDRGPYPAHRKGMEVIQRNSMEIKGKPHWAAAYRPPLCDRVARVAWRKASTWSTRQATPWHETERQVD